MGLKQLKKNKVFNSSLKMLKCTARGNKSTYCFMFLKSNMFQTWFKMNSWKLSLRAMKYWRSILKYYHLFGHYKFYQ